MKNFLLTCLLMTGISISAHADVWRWVDAEGNTHFVDTMKPIYTWTDEFGKAYYSDTPDHEDAVAVQFVWHSPLTLESVTGSGDDGDAESEDEAYPGETEEQRAERKQAEAYYCERAIEIYDSYVNAPQLYRTGEDGEREYLSKQEAQKMIAKTRAKKDELCS